MTKVVTYYSSNAPADKAWLAYAVLPDGSMWAVRFEGASEVVVKANAIATYEAEKAKWQRLDTSGDFKPDDLRGQHLKGTVCMINHAEKKRVRCQQSEVAKLEADGWVRGGPRTQFAE